MTYHQRIEEAQQCLRRGDLLAAEDLLREATELHRRSRFRAPLVEKGLDPILRVGRRLVGRGGGGHVLPHFPERAAALAEEIRALALERSREAADLALLEDGEIGAPQVRDFAFFLRLHRDSDVFRLEAAVLWRILRGYLLGHRLDGDGLEAELVPDPFFLPDPERVWLARWMEAWLSRWEETRASLARSFLEWAEAMVPFGESPERGHWHWIAARLALLGAGDGPRALRLCRQAAREELAPATAAQNLRQLAALECNEHILAACGVDAFVRLDELGALAHAQGHTWPPPELADLLHRRRPAADRPSAVALSWSESGAEFLLLRLHRRAPVDTVVFQLGAEEDTDFGITPTRCRESLQRWLRPSDVVISRGAPPAAIAAVLGGTHRVDLEELGDALPLATPVSAPEPAPASHPLFRDQPHPEPWPELFQRARELLPEAQARLDCPPFRSAWGSENLRSLGSHGLPRCAALAQLARILFREITDPTDGEELQLVPLSLRLRWPTLEGRAWPGRGPRVETVGQVPAEDLLLAERPAVEQLASTLLGLDRAEALVEDPQRAEALAACLARSLDPRRVTVHRLEARCPEPELRTLERWMGEALSDGQRELDLLWLYRALALSPDGAVDVWLDAAPRPRALDELRRRREENEGTSRPCRLEATEAGCWPAQIRSRRRQGRVWISRIEDSRPEDDLPVVVDDLSEAVRGGSDPDARRRLECLARRLEQAPLYVLFADGGVLPELLPAALEEALPAGRHPRSRVGTAAPSRELQVVPPGYDPGSPLLGEEARVLLDARLRLWEEQFGPAPRWEVGLGENDELRRSGRSEEPAADVVLVPSLGGSGELSPLLLLLRLALAATHARRRLVCFDPRVSAVFPELHRGATRIAGEDSPARALDTGAQIFSRSGVRPPASWSNPLSEERLRAAWSEASIFSAATEVAEDRPAALAEALREWSGSARLVVAGGPDAGRRATARLLLELARESRDGGALGVHTVVWAGEGPWPFAEAEDVLTWDEGAAALDERLRRLRGVQLRPATLAEPGLRRWLEESEGLGLCLAPAEVFLKQGAFARGLPWPRLRTDTRVLAFVDDLEAGDPPASRRVAQELDARLARVRPADRGVWRWRRRRGADPVRDCGHCGESQPVAHPLALCARCGAQLLSAHHIEGAARRQRWSALRESLAQANEQRRLVITVDDAQREELRHQLGLAILDGDDAPLFHATQAPEAFVHEIRTASELLDPPPAPAQILLERLPRDAHWMAEVLTRLRAMGWPGGVVEVMDHPLQWYDELPLRLAAAIDPWDELAGRQLRWDAGRAEVEFRYGRALSGLRQRLARRRQGLGHGLMASDLDATGSGSQAALVAALRESDGSAAGDSEISGDLFAQAQGWIVEAVEAAREQGLEFDGREVGHLLLSDLDPDHGRARRHALLLTWARRERLLSAAFELTPGVEPVDRSGVPLPERLSRSAFDAVVPLECSELERKADSNRAKSTGGEEGLAPGQWMGVAASGRTHALVESARARAERGERALVVVPETTGLLRLESERSSLGEVDAVSVQELAVAVLAELGTDELSTVPPRPLPPPGTLAGEEIRQELLREVSRLYAQRCGGVPPLEGRMLRRLIEEESAVARMAAAGDTTVDFDLLRECISQARRSRGWLEERDLFEVARDRVAKHPDLADGWRRRWDAILLDDHHAFEEVSLDLVDRLFPEVPRWEFADPQLSETDEGFTELADGRVSRRVPRAVAAAIDVAQRSRPVTGWPLRTRRRGERGAQQVERVLNLPTCVRAIDAVLHSPDRPPGRVGVVLAHEGDRRQMALLLREEGHRVWEAASVARFATGGPRELLALCLLLFDGPALSPEHHQKLLALLLGQARWDFRELLAEDGDITQLQAEGPGDLRECYVLALDTLGDFLADDQSLDEVARRAARAGVLEGSRRRASSRARLEEFLRTHGRGSWAELRSTVDPAAVADVENDVDAIWILRPRDLPGLRFDHLFHVCSGFEPARRHILVASRCDRRLTTLYSERDPFQG